MSHDHSHRVQNYNKAFAIGIVLNVVFVIVEMIYGVLADSLALIADAGHNISDVVSLLLAWVASLMANRAASAKRTYGFGKVTVMASLLSALLLLMALGGITWEACQRFVDPGPVSGQTIMVVAGIGVVVNTLTALLFMKGQKDDLNIRGAFLHMAADAAVSLGVVIAGLLIAVWGWQWIDPVMTLLIVAVICIGTWGLLRESLNYAIDAVPEDTDLEAIKTYLKQIERVESLHDLHVWPLSTTETALTVHLEVSEGGIDNDFLIAVQRDLHDRFGIEHATIQIEASDGVDGCFLENRHQHD